MRARPVSDVDLSLLFAWEQPRRRNRALIGFLAASLILHALCFYAFQIIYPPAVALLPPPGRVTVIPTNTEEGRRLISWLEAEDPALASMTQPPADRKSLDLPIIQHAPSYLMRLPPLKELPPAPPDPAIPSAQPPAPVEPLVSRTKEATKIALTIVLLSPELEALGTLQSPETKFSASGHESPRAARFRIAVDQNGAVRYCFPETPSGDMALDEQARRYLALSRFSAIRDSETSFASPEESRGQQASSAKVATAAGSEIRNGSGFVWGMATIEWGNDVVTSKPATESTKP